LNKLKKKQPSENKNPTFCRSVNARNLKRLREKQKPKSGFLFVSLTPLLPIVLRKRLSFVNR